MQHLSILSANVGHKFTQTPEAMAASAPLCGSVSQLPRHYALPTAPLDLNASHPLTAAYILNHNYLGVHDVCSIMYNVQFLQEALSKY